jgi:putative FmdB family regulatory protein
MPIYEYVCKTCGNEFELLIRGEEKPECPSCSSKDLTRNFSSPAAHTSAGPKDPGCPSRATCDTPNCCGQNCGMAEFL